MIISSEGLKLPLSKRVIFVKSATGHLCPEPLTIPTLIVDPKTERKVTLPIAMSTLCPVNLLGRDVMIELGIGVIPTPGGMKAVRVGEMGLNVLEGQLEPTYWYSLDLVTTGPSSVTSELSKLAVDKTSPRAQKQNPQDMHCTMLYNHIPGPDKDYERFFFKKLNSKLKLTNVYWDTAGFMGVGCSLLEEDRKLYQGCRTPHVSLAKPEQARWGDVGLFVTKAEMSNTQWVPVSSDPDVLYSPGLQTYCKKLNWCTQAVKAVHMIEKPKQH